MIDTHAHIVKEYYNDIESLVEELKEKNVLKVVNCATSIEDSKEIMTTTKLMDQDDYHYLFEVVHNNYLIKTSKLD